MGYKRIDMTGMTYGMLTVIRRVESRGKTRKERFYLCRCECGTERAFMGKNIRNGRTKSCGCTHPTENHGLAKTPTYMSWASMKSRCNNPAATGYERYGGVGVTVCPEWDASFSAFVRDMGLRPHNKTLDRIDGSKGYSKDNCRWATYKEQANNRRIPRCIRRTNQLKETDHVSVNNTAEGHDLD